MKLNPKLKSLIGTVAPMLGTALGGPLGGLAGKMVQDALGVDSIEQATKMLETDPDALLKLKEAEISFNTRMRELDIDLDKIHAEDRRSAREMAGKTTLLPQIVLGSIFIVGYFVMMGLFFSETLIIPMSDAFYMLIGVMTAAVPQILAFFFGSSSGSKEKTYALAHKND